MNSMKDTYTTQELVLLFDLAKSNVLARAKRESWSSVPRSGRGGGHEWLVSSMPEATRIALASKVCLAPQPAPVTDASVNSLATLSALSVNAKKRWTA